MRKLTLKLLWLLAVVMVPHAVIADTLTDYRLGHFQLDAGYWYGRGTFQLQPPISNSKYTNYANDYSDGIEISGGLGLDHGFALRYNFDYLADSYNISNTKVNTNVFANELDVMFKASDTIPKFIKNVLTLFTDDPFDWSPEPNGKNMFALYLSYRFTYSNTTNPALIYAPLTSNTILIGFYSSTQVSEHFNTFGQVALAFDLSLLGSAGISYKAYKGLDISIYFKYESFMNNGQTFYSKAGFIYGLNYQY